MLQLSNQLITLLKIHCHKVTLDHELMILFSAYVKIKTRRERETDREWEIGREREKEIFYIKWYKMKEVDNNNTKKNDVIFNTLLTIWFRFEYCTWKHNSVCYHNWKRKCTTTGFGEHFIKWEILKSRGLKVWCDNYFRWSDI